jgi:hypothetical protein
MRMMITTNDGELIGIIENIEEYDLDQSVTRAALIYEIVDVIGGFKVMADEPFETTEVQR